MATAIPTWMLGKHITSITATVLTVSTADGSLTDSSGGVAPDSGALVVSSGSYPTHSITTGLCDEIEYQGGLTLENISAVTSTHAHHVAIARNDAITVTEILRTGATGTNPYYGNCLLANLWHSGTSRVVLFVFARAGNTHTFYGTMTGYEEGIRRGKSVGRMTIQMVDPGSSVAFNDNYT